MSLTQLILCISLTCLTHVTLIVSEAILSEVILSEYHQEYKVWARGKRSSKDSSSKANRSFDANKVREEGKALYKKKEFKRAKSLFVELVQHQPTNAEDYTYLARSAMRAGDYLVASVAYLIYFDLTKKPKAKLRQEYQEAKNNISEGMDQRKLTAHKERLSEVLKLIKEGELSGSKGAFATLEDIHREQIFHPHLKRAYQRFKTQLLKDHEALSARLSQLENSSLELQKHKKLLEDWGNSSWGERETATRKLSALELLADLDTHPEIILDSKKAAELEERGFSKNKIRRLQLEVLIKQHRQREIYLMADGLVQSISPESKDPHELRKLRLLQLLRSIYGSPQVKVQALQDLFMIPSMKARKALKLTQTSNEAKSTTSRPSAFESP